MEGLLNTLFGPLPEEYCLYFYFISIFGGIFALIAFIHIVVLLLFSKDSKKWQLISAFSMIFFMYFILYFKSRLLNTMCKSSLGNR